MISRVGSGFDRHSGSWPDYPLDTPMYANALVVSTAHIIRVLVWALNLPTRTKKKMTVQTLLKDLIAYANELTDLGAEREARAVIEFLNRVKATL